LILCRTSFFPAQAAAAAAWTLKSATVARLWFSLQAAHQVLLLLLLLLLRLLLVQRQHVSI